MHISYNNTFVSKCNYQNIDLTYQEPNFMFRIHWLFFKWALFNKHFHGDSFIIFSTAKMSSVSLLSRFKEMDEYPRLEFIMQWLRDDIKTFEKIFDFFFNALIIHWGCLEGGSFWANLSFSRKIALTNSKNTSWLSELNENMLNNIPT